MSGQMWVFDGASLVELVLRSTLVLLGTLAVLALLRKGNARPRSVVLATAFPVLMLVLGLSMMAGEGPWSGLRVELPVDLWSQETPERPETLVPGTSGTVEGESSIGPVAEGSAQDRTEESIGAWLPRGNMGSAALLAVDDGSQSSELSSALVRPSTGNGWLLLPRVLVSVWLLGTLVLLLRVGVSLVNMQRITSRSRPASPMMVGALEELAPAHRSSSLPTLLVSQEIAVPMTWGVALGPWFRPVVLLPVRAEKWSRQRLQVVLLHELGHVTLGDWAARLMTRMVRCAYWWQPLAHWACQRLELEQELACDEWVVRQVKPSEYAQHLLSLHRELRGQRSQAPAMALPMLSKQQLERRVMNLLDPSVLRRSTGRPALLVALCFMFLVAAVQPEVVRRTVSPVEMAPEVAPLPVVPRTPPSSGPSVSVWPERLKNSALLWQAPSAPSFVPQAGAVLAPQASVAPLRSWVGPLAAPPLTPRAVSPAVRFPGAFAVAPAAPVAGLVPSGVRSPRVPRVAGSALQSLGLTENEEELTEQEKQALARVRQHLAELEARSEAVAQELEEGRQSLLRRAEELHHEAERNQNQREREMARLYEQAHLRSAELEALAQEQARRQEEKMRFTQESALHRAQQGLAAAERQRYLVNGELQEQRAAAMRAFERSARERGKELERLERKELRERRPHRERELERARSQRSEGRLRELDARVRAREQQRESDRGAALADLERLREELGPRTEKLSEMERQLKRERLSTLRNRPPLPPDAPVLMGQLAPRAPVVIRPRTPRFAPGLFDLELHEQIAAVIREEALALGLEEPKVAAAAESVVAVLGTHHQVRSENGKVVADKVYVVGSPAEVRDQLNQAWQEELDISAGTQKQAQLLAAIGRLAYEILELRRDD